MTSRTRTEQCILVLGGSTGKTGRRVAARLAARGIPLRVGSRTAALPFDWDDQQTCAPALQGITASYIAYVPDLAVPGTPASIRAFTEFAVQGGVQRLVLLSGRGEEAVQHCEQIVQGCGIEWTIVRASWFAQNLSEGFMHDLVMGGVVALPIGDVAEPFVDAEDIVDVAAAALIEHDHAGHIYESTGPRLLTFAEAVEEIATATGRNIRAFEQERRFATDINHVLSKRIVQAANRTKRAIGPRSQAHPHAPQGSTLPPTCYIKTSPRNI